MTQVRAAHETGNASKLKETWQDFKWAFMNPNLPFHPLQWFYWLASALCQDVCDFTGVSALMHRRQCRQKIRAIIPLFAISLVLLVIFAYFASIRRLVRDRWCLLETTCSVIDASQQQGKQVQQQCTNNTCLWIHVHDTIVAYFGIMILFHYITTTVTSPGVALSAAVMSSSSHKQRWNALDAQGGWWGWNPPLSIEKEARLLSLYHSTMSSKKLQTSSSATNSPDDTVSSSSKTTWLFPSPEPSFCNKCNIARPPRCHHCSACHRCVLQFDHHCVWLNNCIGYNNYRGFVLILFYIMLGCWYGVAMLFWPFYEPLREQIRSQPSIWRWLYANGRTGLLDLPPLMNLLPMLIKGQVTVKMVIDLVYPLLLSVGAVMSAFLGYHVKYMGTARTSLEHKIILEHYCVALYRKEALPTVDNPFDQGFWNNLKQILGPRLWLILLPIPVEVPGPFVPKHS